MIVKRKSSLLVFLVFASFIFGCGKLPTEQSLIKKVNADDKSFKGSWVYKSQMPGQFTCSVGTRISIEVSGKKFHLIGDCPADERRTEEWIHDGRVLWQLIPSQKQVDWLEMKGFGKGPFWKMPIRMKPFGPIQETGEEEIAGRICKLLKIKGRYEQGDVTLSYWVDREKNLLLKKEHLLEAGGGVLVNEVYECENIEFAPTFREGTFNSKIPSDWLKVKKRYLDCELLDTKF